MAVDVLTQIDIARPRAEVAEYAAHPSNTAEWYVNIKSVEWHGAAELRVGAKIDFVAHFLGRRLSYTYEVTEHIPGESLTMRTSDGPFPMQTEYLWTDLPDGGTRMTLRNTGEPAGFGRVAAPVMGAAMRRANQKDLGLLKQILEAR
ncbi:MAG: SRPBCC family protein [Gemmatimonadota bacterium]|nr:SRPBCC family protein [Gemmatimonadota bacterium]